VFIYQITNNINGKRYIGKTSKPSVLDRWKTHISDSKRSNTKLYNAIKKYGIESFTIDIFECTGNISREKLNEREKYWIEVLEPEYNMTKGGDGGWINNQTGKHWKIKDTSNMKGKKTVTEKVKQGWLKNSGKNNYQSKYKIHTPWGCFFTWKDAIIEAKRLKKIGVREVITNSHTLQCYCLDNILLNKEGRRTVPVWRGQFTKNLGFYVENNFE
jgi:group I intron endonuclease